MPIALGTLGFRFSVFEVLIQWHIYERPHRLTSTENNAVDREKELHLPRRKEHWVRVCAVLELHLPLIPDSVFGPDKRAELETPPFLKVESRPTFTV